jgi:hypothetical protein
MARGCRGTVFCVVLACSPGAGPPADATGTTGSTTASGPTTTAVGDTTEGQATTADVPLTTSSSSGPDVTSSATTDGTTTSATSGEPGSSESSSGERVGLRVEPAAIQIDVTSGWSFPVQFTAVLEDGFDTPVAAEWSVDDAGLARVTRFGGTLAARGTAGGVLEVSATFEGQAASAAIEVVIADDHPVCPPRPPLTDGPLAAGAYRRVVAPEYEGKGVYHGVYLPPDWTPGRRYPVIVESPCNAYQTFTGEVEDTRLGYYVSGCRHYVWIVLPYIQGEANLDYGWGELAANLAYWQTNVRRTLEQVGGDPGSVIVAGFSRGAIGAGWIGLQEPEIADAWLGFFMHSHADVVSNLTPDGGAGSSGRMMRVAGRASLLSWGAAGDGGSVNSVKGVELLTGFGYPVTQLAVPGVGHTDAWIFDDAASVATAQDWLFATVAARPGTGSVYGRVTDTSGAPVAGVRVESGPLHFAITDAAGYYGLRGLVIGPRAVTCAQPGCDGPQMVAVAAADVEDVDFVVTP